MNCSSTEQPPLYSVTFKSTTSIILSKKFLIASLERSNKIERERERERERTKLKRNEWELEFRKIMNY